MAPSTAEYSMRLLVIPLLLGLTACGGSSTTAPTSPNSAGSSRLAVGDPAPPLTADLWLNGPEVKGFEPCKVYVLDFWAIWCQPCIEIMPHLAELQHEFREKGLVVIPVTTTTNSNPLPRITDFVKRRGAKLGLTFAVDQSSELDRAYMQASGSEALPTSFVVDRQGKIAFIGHPILLDDVLPRVLAGTWRGTADIEAIEQMRLDLDRAFERAELKPAEGHLAFAEFEKKHPGKAKQPSIQSNKVIVLVRAKQFDEARKLTESLIPRLVAIKGTSSLNTLRSAWGDRSVNPEQKHLDLAVKAAEAAVTVEGENDPIALFGLADAHHAAGNHKQAIETAEKAVQTAGDNAELKAFFEKQLAKYRETRNGKEGK